MDQQFTGREKPSTKQMPELFVMQDLKSDARSSNPALQSPSTVSLFGIRLHQMTMSEVAARLVAWCREPRGVSCRYVVTPNVDHVVLYQELGELRSAYEAASLVLADGLPVVWASRMLRKPLPERVAGSDLVPMLFDKISLETNAAVDGTGSVDTADLRVFLLGAAEGVGERAAECIHQRWSGVQVVGTYCPPVGFETDEAENARILQTLAEAQPDLLVLGLGAPKQELWIRTHHRQVQAKVALCAGATIDFLAGHRQRAPVWMQKTGLEWLHRLYREPRRLAFRYARDAWIYPQLVWREFYRHGA